jgi:integrase
VSVRAFLTWAADPRNQGRAISKSLQEIVDELSRLRAVFGPFTRYSSASERISPLDPSQVERVLSVVGPARDSQGRCMVPLSFGDTNPYRPQSQLRNWLMFAIALQCGLRRGELLKVRLDDIPKPNDPGLKVRRRPHDRSDTRRYRPRVKTSERVIPISAEIRVGLRAYLSAPPPMGRPSGRTPYLFVSKDGHPLSIPAADEIPKIACHQADVPGFSWHSLRHTWAEAVADELLTQFPEDQALAFIRELGGWKRNSNVPMHYIQDAIAKRANEYLRDRNARLYGTGGDNN